MSPGMRRLPSLAGPVCVALGAWCALGAVAPLTPDRALPRLAVPAPWWSLVLLVAAAAVVPAWRRRPVLALPALLSVLPWLPVPLPAVALMWTGPLAWLPVAAVLFATAGPPVAAWVGRRVEGWSPLRSSVTAGVLTLACGGSVAWAVSPYTPGGDEPHYLIVTQSLIADGDLKIENNHENREYLAYFPLNLDPSYLQRGASGEIYSIHMPGLPAALVPAFWLFGYRGAQLTLLLLAAVAGGLIWHAGWLASGDRRAAWFGWAVVATSLTFLIQSAAIFPDGPGAFVVAAAAWTLVCLARAPDRVGGRTLIGVGALLGSLPWLHTRFAILAAGLGLALSLALLADPTRQLAARARRIALLLSVPAVAAVGWFAYFRVVYGTFDPTAPYAAADSLRWAFVPAGLLAVFVDQQFGLLLYAPALAAGLAGIWMVRALPARRWVWPMAGAALAYLAVATRYWMWWVGGPAPPARLATAVLPALALAATVAWHRASLPLRAVWSALLALSAATTLVTMAVARGYMAYNLRSDETRWLEWLGPLVNLPRGWPSFFWALDPTELSSEIAFFGHAAVTLVVVVGGGSALVWLGRARSWKGSRLAGATALGVLLLLMVVTSSGWTYDGAPTLDPARAQLSALAWSRAGRPAVVIDTLSVRHGQPEPRLVIRGEEPPVRGGLPHAYFPSVPPGDYEIWVEVADPVLGSLGVRVGRSPDSLRIFDAGRRSSEAFRLPLPAGAVDLSLEPDERLLSRPLRLAIAPVASAPARGTEAWMGLSYNDVDAFFMDRGAFAESSGFWVRGGETAELVFVPPAGRLDVTLDLQNVPVPNRVEVSGAVDSTVALAPGERRSLQLPVDPTGAVRVRVSSSAGFVPSQASGSVDGRFLGVWGEVK